MSAIEQEFLTNEMLEEDTLDVSDVMFSVDDSDNLISQSESEFSLSELFDVDI